MEFVFIIALGILAGGYIGLCVRTWVLLVLTALVLFFGLGMPRETLAAVITVAYWFVVGPSLFAAWFIHITISGWVPKDWYKIFIRKD